MQGFVLLLFFLSGAAGLAYEVTWVRSFGLVFGASHLAVTTVLAVYMGGLAAGGALFGRRADRSTRPLRLYAFLELGVAAGALLFPAIMEAFSRAYLPLARVSGQPVYLTAVRVLFAALALGIPTTLMGGTLPVLARFVGSRTGSTRSLSFLYAVNTFGAVTGTLAASFWLLRVLGASRTLMTSAAVSALVGVGALALDRLVGASPPGTAGHEPPKASRTPDERTRRLALVASGVSGFCALGYEVLWTRMLSLVAGTTVYSFAIMLAAFLTGIALGSHAYGIVVRRSTARRGAATFVLGAVQVAIGITALVSTVLMRDLPIHSDRIQLAFLGTGQTSFDVRLLSTASVAFLFFLVPAVFMGAAFPAAAEAWGGERADQGRVVGQLLLVNTAGSILGPVVTGFVLVYAIGIERSLHALVIVNLTMGLVLWGALSGRTVWSRAIPLAAGIVVLAARIASPGWGRVWDQKYFATFTNNAREFTTPERVRELMNEVEILYYKEGVDETVSAIRTLGHLQSFIVNGRTEASTSRVDVALQRSLGHLPMLLHPNPRRAFVLGTGTGMTLGSISIHPELQEVVLGEIEESMLGVARAFARWNHGVLDSPRLRVVINDGRNFLATTSERFDVISADPVHPWSGGAGYLYTQEYFGLVAARLAPGGIACQWLPIYELSERDLRTIVRTFSTTFQHVMMWMTYYDVALVGSNAPLTLDEDALERRLQAAPRVREDLAEVQMGSGDDILDFFLAGTRGAREFSRGGVINTDDNLWLEFSAPESQGVTDLPGRNVLALSGIRESVAGYLDPSLSEGALTAARRKWDAKLDLGRMVDKAQARTLLGRPRPEIDPLLELALRRDPDHGPTKFLVEERRFELLTEPKLVVEKVIPPPAPGMPSVRLSGVRQFVDRERVLVSVVDNSRRRIYGQRYLDGAHGMLEAEAQRFLEAAMERMRVAALRPERGAAGAASGLDAILDEEGRRAIGSIRPTQGAGPSTQTQ